MNNNVDNLAYQGSVNKDGLDTDITNSPKTSRDINHTLGQEILGAIEALKQGSGFGSVEIVLHDGRVTQIEKREKLRFTQDPTKSIPTARATVKYK